MGSWAEEGAAMGPLPIPEAGEQSGPHLARSSSLCPQYLAHVPSTTVRPTVPDNQIVIILNLTRVTIVFAHSISDAWYLTSSGLLCNQTVSGHRK